MENTAVTVQTPEQTHRLFVDALKKGDFDAAVNCCFREGDRAGMKANLEEIKQKGRLGQMIGDLDTVITPELVSDMTASYSYVIKEGGQKFGSDLSFTKTFQGIWYIESL
jgi:hypothetical protein